MSVSAIMTNAQVLPIDFVHWGVGGCSFSIQLDMGPFVKSRYTKKE